MCPHCGQRHDAETSVDLPTGTTHEEPMPAGSVALCLRCGEPSILEADNTLRLADLDELLEIELSSEWRRAKWAWLQMRASLN